MPALINLTSVKTARLFLCGAPPLTKMCFSTTSRPSVAASSASSNTAAAASSNDISSFAASASASASSSAKPKVLRIGSVKFAHDAWRALEKQAQVLTLPSDPKDYSRAQFFQDLRANPAFHDIRAIARDLETKRYVGLFDAELIAELPPSLGLVITRSAGYDEIDVSALTRRRVQMAHTPNLVSPDTADTNVFLIMAALRNFQPAHNNLLAGRWPQSGGVLGAGTPEGHSPKGKAVGILGNGKIGREILKRLQPFGFHKFIYHNRNKLSPELEGGARYVSFDELLAQSDVLSINVPLSSSTKHIINSTAIAKMKQDVVIVNTARGAVVDEQALLQGLKSGKVFAAGLDVFENEPFGVNLELLSLPNVVSLPHMGTHTVETIKEMEEFVVKNIKEFLDTGRASAVVPEQKDADFY